MDEPEPGIEEDYEAWDVDCAELEKEVLPPSGPAIGEWTAKRIGAFNSRLEQALMARQIWAVKKKYKTEPPMHMVLNIANQVFEFNGWSHRIVRMSPIELTESHEEAVEALGDLARQMGEGETATGLVITATQTAFVEVVFADGTTLMGKGEGVGRSRHKGLAIAGCKKLAVSAGLKRVFLAMGE